jgi:hypothetical protein
LLWKFLDIPREEYETLYREKLKDAVEKLTKIEVSGTESADSKDAEEIPRFDDEGEDE